MSLSLQNACGCIGLQGNISVLNDFFGYRRGKIKLSNPANKFVKATDSLRAQLKVIKENFYVHINFFQVGFDIYSDNEFIDIEAAIHNLRSIYSQVNMGIGRVKYYKVLTTETPGYHYIQEDADAKLLTLLYTGQNDACDVFLVLTYKGTTIGISEKDGPCNKDDTDYGMTGSVVAIQEGSDTIGLDTANVIAHEVGHYLGLGHFYDFGAMYTCLSAISGGEVIIDEDSEEFGDCLKSQPGSAKARLMFPNLTPSNPGPNNTLMINEEGKTIKIHCFSHLPCV
jgi:reprolysin-like metallo-peptidase family M12B